MIGPFGQPPAALDRWVTRDGVRLHCLDWGGPAGGPVVLLMHGVGGNALIWNDVAPLLREGLPGCRIVAVDTRDGGRTDHPATGYALSEFVADVLAVADDLGAPRVSLVGHSRGGWLAACVAALHPGRVERIVLLDPARITFGTMEAGDAAYAWIFGNLGPFASRAAAVAWASAAEPMARWTATRVGALLDNLVDQPDGTVAGRLPRAAMEQLRAARADGERIAYEAVTAPTLLILASGLGEQHMADRLEYAQRIPDTRVARVLGTHFLHTDAPAEVAALVVEHLQG
jgi:pimeloyl-ACP methyl ester carboxylesterase